MATGFILRVGSAGRHDSDAVAILIISSHPEPRRRRCAI
jgi:hypothetical protein